MPTASPPPLGPWIAPVRPPIAALIRERQRQRVAERRCSRAPLKPHCTPRRPRELARRLHDARFDLDLRLRPIERGDQRRWRASSRSGRSLMMSVLVRASVWIEPRCDSTVAVMSVAQVLRLRVAERPRQHAQLAGERLLVGQLAALRFFVGQHRQRRDADDGAVDDVAKLVGAQDDVERLVPRHVAQRDVHRALNRRIDDDVQTADLGERAEHGAQVGALEVEADRVAGEARGAAPPAPAGTCAAGAACGLRRGACACATAAGSWRRARRRPALPDGAPALSASSAPRSGSADRLVEHDA